MNRVLGMSPGVAAAAVAAAPLAAGSASAHGAAQRRCPRSRAAGEQVQRARSRPAGAARRLQAPRGDLRGEPLLRQPVRRLGKRQRPARQRSLARHRGAHHPGRAERHEVLLPARRTTSTCQPAAAGRLRRQRPRRHQPLREQAVRDRPLHQARRHHLPPPGVFAPNGVAKGSGAARRLHPRHRAPLLPGAVPDPRRPAGPLHDRLRRGRPDPGLLQDPRPADLQVPAPHGRARSTSWPTASSRPRSAARSSTTSG